ncbi:hypothetical protein [Ruania halotolerans]|uniref:hypothetical protein n=1 Tax=Ruania halotolerans TaxID=2897773 RepID=UPI001E3D443C|nr:hypothetical protein [Ruania halotolerans]UFU06429.1 hypothetical protein LQF10_18720 [Ruania halotolerans]
MDSFWQFVGGYWWLIFPLGGIVGGWVKGAQKWDERRRRDKIELQKLKNAERLATQQVEEARSSEIERVLAEHDEVNRRWLDYELDVAKLIDYPVMTDMREQVTADFHRAKRDADLLRPDDPAELRDPRLLARYREAVREFGLTFDIAEREARRRRTSDFTETERAALNRAKKLLALADDSGATHAERQAAYRRATRELEGLLVLPDAATDALEQRIAGMLGTAPE